MRKLLTSLAIMAAVAGPAVADDDRLVKAVNLQDLEIILAEEGHTVMNTGAVGDVSVRAMDTYGMIFELIGTACGTEYSVDCLGINMRVLYDANGEETLERINEANLLWAATSTWYSKPGVIGASPKVGITRYVILDGGMTIRNIKDNLLNLLSMAPDVADYVWQTGDYAPGADGVVYNEDEYYDEEW